ncbi:MAG: hypothetical protein R3A45_08490 [Bdellovibrionota bacterium]
MSKLIFGICIFLTTSSFAKLPLVEVFHPTDPTQGRLFILGTVHLPLPKENLHAFTQHYNRIDQTFPIVHAFSEIIQSNLAPFYPKPTSLHDWQIQFKPQVLDLLAAVTQRSSANDLQEVDFDLNYNFAQFAFDMTFAIRKGSIQPGRQTYQISPETTLDLNVTEDLYAAFKSDFLLGDHIMRAYQNHAGKHDHNLSATDFLETLCDLLNYASQQNKCEPNLYPYLSLANEQSLFDLVLDFLAQNYFMQDVTEETWATPSDDSQIIDDIALNYAHRHGGVDSFFDLDRGKRVNASQYPYLYDLIFDYRNNAQKTMSQLKKNYRKQFQLGKHHIEKKGSHKKGEYPPSDPNEQGSNAYRNKHWTPDLTDFMQNHPGQTALVVVGEAHVMEDLSVLHYLELAGYEYRFLE